MKFEEMLEGELIGDLIETKEDGPFFEESSRFLFSSYKNPMLRMECGSESAIASHIDQNVPLATLILLTDDNDYRHWQVVSLTKSAKKLKLI